MMIRRINLSDRNPTIKGTKHSKKVKDKITKKKKEKTKGKTNRHRMRKTGEMMTAEKPFFRIRDKYSKKQQI